MDLLSQIKAPWSLNYFPAHTEPYHFAVFDESKPLGENVELKYESTCLSVLLDQVQEALVPEGAQRGFLVDTLERLQRSWSLHWYPTHPDGCRYLLTVYGNGESHSEYLYKGASLFEILDDLRKDIEAGFLQLKEVS